MQARLDYPHVNCAQCSRLEAEDGVVPDCEHCPIPYVSEAIRGYERIYSLLSRPFIREAGLAQWVMEVLIPSGDRDDVLTVLDQVCTIDEVIRQHGEESG